MIDPIDPSTPFADVIKQHGDKFLPLLPPALRLAAGTLASSGLTLGQVTAMIDVAARRAIVEKAPPEFRSFVAHMLEVKE
jgi:hypothetical protein